MGNLVVGFAIFNEKRGILQSSFTEMIGGAEGRIHNQRARPLQEFRPALLIRDPKDS